MINILDELVTYLGSKVSLTPGQSIYYNSMPDTPDLCVVLNEVKQGKNVPPQIDASTQYIKVTVRAATTREAYAKATECYRWLLSDTNDLTDPNGFISMLSGLTVYIQLHGNPIWEQTDQRGRRYYYFTMTTITKRLI